jgi:hypothetical protein
MVMCKALLLPPAPNPEPGGLPAKKIKKLKKKIAKKNSVRASATHGTALLPAPRAQLASDIRDGGVTSHIAIAFPWPTG